MVNHEPAFRFAATLVALCSLALGIALVTSCSSDADQHPTNEQAARRLFPPLCERYQVCRPEDFAATWPTGVNQCVGSLVDLAGSDALSRASPCTNAQVDTCVADSKALACSALQQSITEALPASCKEC